MKPGLLSVILTMSLTTLLFAQDKFQLPPAVTALYEGVQSETLPNGLRVFIKPIPGSPVVTTMMIYKVGACDEDKGFTGLSHYLEHLLFKGTHKLLPGDIDRMTQQSGGSNNAYTSEDVTNYHFDFAADKWETALEIEADRMRNVLIDAKHEFQQEKGAVTAELDRNEDGPWDLEQKALLPLLFGKSSPYGHPVIGEKEHVRAATAEIIKGYYDKWYHPNNASFIIVGGVDAKVAMSKVKEKFKDIPSVNLPARKPWVTNPTALPAKTEFISKFPLARMLAGYMGVPSGHADEPALDLFCEILAGGKTSRLYKKLVLESRVANQVGAGNSTGRHPGWVGVQLELLPKKDRAAAEKLAMDEVKKLQEGGVTAEELERAKRLLLASEIYSLESVHGLADHFARAVTITSLEEAKGRYAKLLAVTAADVQRVGKQYLDPAKQVVVWSVPKAQPAGGGAADPNSKNGIHRTSKLHRNKESLAQGGGASVSVQDAKKVVLKNGLSVIMLENKRLPILSAAASVAQVRLREPSDKAGIAQLAGQLLEEGTKSRTGEQIASTIENVGGQISMSGAGGSIKVLAADRKLGLELLIDCLTRPSFPQEAFDRKKEEQLAEIAEVEFTPISKAQTELNALVYGNHPFGRPGRGTLDSVQKLKREDAVAFHKAVFVPKNTTIAVVGDFNSAELLAELEALTADWNGDLAALPARPEVAMPAAAKTKIITMPDAEQLQLFLAHPGIKRDSKDYFPLLVMDNVLGVGSGFTDRLSSRLRDREGLAYTVSADICSSATEEPGMFSCYIGTEAKNFERARKLFLEEIERLRKEPPTEKELDGAKQYLLGKLAFLTTTNGQIASYLLTVDRYKLGFDYLDTYRKSVHAVTAEQVRQMASSYLQPGKLTTVAAGAIDVNGFEIRKTPGKN